MARDFVGEMRAVIDAATSGQDSYVAGVVAMEIVDKLRATDAELLHGWLDAQAVQFIREAIGARDRSIRSRGQRFARARDFGAAMERFDGGDGDALTSYMTTFHFTVEGNERKALGKLTHDDLLYARDDYQGRADENLFYVAVLGALAEQVTDGVVEDHFTEAQLQNMFGMFR